MKRVLLTGGSGFIGRNILESSLKEEFTLLAPTHSELDLLDRTSLDRWLLENEVDYILHAATKPGHRNAKDSSNLFYSNIRMFFNISRHAERVEKIIVLGSGAIYDMQRCHPLMREPEWSECFPEDDHGFCKYVCETFIEKAANIIDLRIFGIFGKYEDYSIRFISNMICKSLFDLPLTIKEDRVFSYLFIDDLMPILDEFLRSPIRTGAFNITTGERFLLSDLARAVLRAMDKDLPVVVAREGRGTEYTGDNAKLMQAFPNLVFTPIDESIERLCDWYRSNSASIDRDTLRTDK